MADRKREDPATMNTEEDEDFVRRWSRRKHEATRVRAPAPPQEEAAPSGGESADTGPTDAHLPAPESLGPDSDYSAFLSKRVSEGLRRAALRKLFHQPQFNVRDGLDDYDEDYRSFASLGETITADMRFHRERLREKAQRAEDEERPPEETADAEADAERPSDPAQEAAPDEVADNDARQREEGDEGHG